MARWFVDRSPQRGIPSVSLRRLLPEAQFVGCQDWEVSGCTADSRRLDPGQVFVAVEGSQHDGHTFVTKALERGAAGVVVERPCPEAGRLQVVVPDSRLALARLCHALAGDPSQMLRLLAVTGSSGKTVTSLFLRSIFEATGARVGLVTPMGWSDGISTHHAGRGTLGAESLARILAAMVERGCDGGVLRVSHEDLNRRAAEAVQLEVAVITSLGDHSARPTTPAPFLQPSAEAAAEALYAERNRAAALVRQVAPGGATVVNADDPQAELLGAVNLNSKRVSFGLDRPADLTARIDSLAADGTRIRLLGLDRERSVHLHLVGSRQVRFALAAAAAARACGLPDAAIVAGLEAVTCVPGRLEPVGQGQPFDVWVDRARTARELRLALGALRGVCRGMLTCVLGAEGHLERSHRLELAAAAEACADRVVLTTDNPRTEDPDQILDDLLAGFHRPGRVRVIADRRLAIETALSNASASDGLLIAGKGRDAFQIFADRAIAFDDRAIVMEWLKQAQVGQKRNSA